MSINEIVKADDRTGCIQEESQILVSRTITRLDGTKRETVVDRLLKEGRVTLVLDGEEQVTVVCTPGEEQYWAVGHLKCRRLLSCRDDIASLEVTPCGVSVKRKHRIEGLPLLKRILSSSASVCLAEEAATRLGSAIPLDWSMPASVLRKGVEWLASAPIFRATGGTHVAALMARDGEKLFRTEDIGRHNAVDKVVGWAVLHDVPLGETAMVISGRLPVDMAMKALGAGIPVLGSISAAIAEGVEAAERGGLTLVGFIRGERMNIYTHPERITDDL